ncbi:hypothetical protein Acr_13g0006440 [Actinidia rufa]|uniref:Uncharacterized protein n=1 Tax=Actinidia rufa TaxID=165716 RepID=A0A7J0FKZ3_9ERIC|nr:hypothetical protein Acr_13g0006440 [Actinidia rufa]
METAAAVGVSDGDGGELLVFVVVSVVIAGDSVYRSMAYNMAVRARTGHKQLIQTFC